jgi:multicomponent Na+:H+ antiporter subunit D
MKLLLLSPLLVPFLTAIASLLLWRRRHAQRLLGVAGACALLASSLGLLAAVWRHGIQAVQVGNWPAPFGITLVADLFSALLVVMAGLVGLAVAVYSLAAMDAERESFGYYPLLQILLMGVCGAFITGDIFNLYVWFEVMLIASFVLLGLGGERAQLEGTIKYVTLNLMSSALFLAAVGILYGAVGTLNMADLALQLGAVRPPELVTTLAMLFLVAFGIKAAIFPLFFWLPASYHTPPVPVSAVFAGLLTKVGVYALIRVFTLLFVHDVRYTHKLILILAGFTLVTGILGALIQRDFRRVLSFNVISHIGYMVMGLGIFTPLALVGSVYYIIHDIIVKTTLFLVAGVVHRLLGTYELKKLGGLYSIHPGVSLLFLIPALSLGGIPPLSGFWGKFMLVKAGLEAKQYVIAAIALVVGLLSLLSMMELWSEAFWKRASDVGQDKEVQPDSPHPFGSRVLLLFPVAALGSLTILMGLFVAPIFAVATRAVEQLANPDDYIRTVLGGPP